MQLEKQIQMLGGFGFALEPGVAVEDLLYSFDREGYEAEPFDLIFFIMGVEIEREPWGRRFCKRIWTYRFISFPGFILKTIRVQTGLYRLLHGLVPLPSFLASFCFRSRLIISQQTGPILYCHCFPSRLKYG